MPAMTHPLFDLSGRVALVTGAASGMGKQMALGFAEAGADLVLADLNLPGAEESAAEIHSLGRRALPFQCDVSKPEQITTMFEVLDAEFGRIDILGNVAGEGIMGPPEDTDVSVVIQVAQNLVFGRFVACREAGTRMLAQGKGSIINIGSIGGWNSLGRGHAAYGMAMASVIQMTRELSTEWAGRGVRVNAILPAQVLNAGPRRADGAQAGIEGRVHWRDPNGSAGPPGRDQGSCHLPGFGRGLVRIRRDPADGRWQPGDERRRFIPGRTASPGLTPQR